MGEIERLKSGMPVVDVASHFVGYVEHVDQHAFTVAVAPDASVELTASALFWVDEHVATLICVRERIDRYAA